MLQRFGAYRQAGVYRHMRDFVRIAFFQDVGQLTLPLVRHPADATTQQDDAPIAAEQFGDRTRERVDDA